METSELQRSKKLDKFVGYKLELIGEDPFYRNHTPFHEIKCKTIVDTKEELRKINEEKDYLQHVLPSQYELESINITEHCENGDVYEVVCSHREIGEFCTTGQGLNKYRFCIIRLTNFVSYQNIGIILQNDEKIGYRTNDDQWNSFLKQEIDGPDVTNYQPLPKTKPEFLCHLRTIAEVGKAFNPLTPVLIYHTKSLFDETLDELYEQIVVKNETIDFTFF